MKLKALLAEFESSLNAAGFESPASDAAVLFADFLGLGLGELPLKGALSLPDSQVAGLRAALARRLANEPLQYISGTAYFRFLKLKVGLGCLIPRPETELLAEMAMEAAPEGGLVCEIGAGSGALGLSIAYERTDLKVFASELSPEAFAWASRNAAALALPNYSLRAGDMLSPFENDRFRFDAIVANLPYIPSAIMHSLPKDVGGHEPSFALDGGPDGLDPVRRAIVDAPRFLKPGGLLALEIGEEQGEATARLFASSAFYMDICVRRDLCGKDRFVTARFASC